MAFCVFIHRSDSIYDDSPAEHYQFPQRYLGWVKQCVGNWIVYLEPSKVRNTRGYFAIAKVKEIVPDLTAEKMYLALIEPGSYIDFLRPVAFNLDGNPVEIGLLNDKGKMSGRAQSAVRTISARDFERIIDLGFEGFGTELPRLDTKLQEEYQGGFGEERSDFMFDFVDKRVRVEQLSTRKIRDPLFRKLILNAYDKRCAISGLKLINGGGRAEVDAAHIMPVSADGPDILCNGIALSGTHHWMFDRGLISLSDTFEVLVSRHVNDPMSVRSLINKTGVAIVPQNPRDRPHPKFLKWHRENCFKF